LVFHAFSPLHRMRISSTIILLVLALHIKGVRCTPVHSHICYCRTSLCRSPHCRHAGVLPPPIVLQSPSLVLVGAWWSRRLC
jgi:hypothetical protein